MFFASCLYGAVSFAAETEELLHKDGSVAFIQIL